MKIDACSIYSVRQESKSGEERFCYDVVKKSVLFALIEAVLVYRQVESCASPTFRGQSWKNRKSFARTAHLLSVIAVLFLDAHCQRN